MAQYKRHKSHDERVAEFSQMHTKHPDRKCIVFETKDVNLKKFKFLTPQDMTLGQLLTVVRKHMENIPATTALFMFSEDNIVLSPSMLVSQVHTRHQSNDGAVYIMLRKENTFGANHDFLQPL